MSEPTVSSNAPVKLQDENQSVVKAAGVIGIVTFSSRILGFIRDMLLAGLWRESLTSAGGLAPQEVNSPSLLLLSIARPSTF